MANLVVVSKLKEVIKQEEMSCASDLPDALDVLLTELVKKACARAKSNDRKTVRPGDL
ncbi:MAG: DUF1931 domain-containing protein [Candidatus Aenigmarchaeota archaeon]|nr:DUF1931 domain-containing protein [Candidatus Aenigmarchaeota archaeon]